MNRGDRVFMDTNAIIEAVRTRCWSAITGQLPLETVEACRQEVFASPPRPTSGYVVVSEEDLLRLASIHAVDSVLRAALKLDYGAADGLDAGEQDLLAHAYGHPDAAWVLCSPDKASVRAAMALGFGERLCSLEELVVAVGVKPRPPLRVHFRTEWLVSFRTKVLLEDL